MPVSCMWRILNRLKNLKKGKKRGKKGVRELLFSAGWDVAELKCVPAWRRSLWLLEVNCLCALLESIQAADCSVWVPAVVSGTSTVRKQLRSCASWRHKEATLDFGRRGQSAINETKRDKLWPRVNLHAYAHNVAVAPPPPRGKCCVACWAEKEKHWHINHQQPLHSHGFTWNEQLASRDEGVSTPQVNSLAVKVWLHRICTIN